MEWKMEPLVLSITSLFHGKTNKIAFTRTRPTKKEGRITNPRKRLLEGGRWVELKKIKAVVPRYLSFLFEKQQYASARESQALRNQVSFVLQPWEHLINIPIISIRQQSIDQVCSIIGQFSPEDQNYKNKPQPRTVLSVSSSLICKYHRVRQEVRTTHLWNLRVEIKSTYIRCPRGKTIAKSIDFRWICKEC